MIDARNRIADGAEAVRRECSKLLSMNRYNCRTQFYDAVGFILFKFSMDGKEKANSEGFVVDLPTLSAFEKETFTSREKLSNAVPAAITSDSDVSDIDEANLRLIQDLPHKFPNLVVNIEYPVTIVDDVGDQTRYNGGDKRVPDSYIRKETNSLISLSLVLLTEYTRSGSTRHFLKCSKRSLQSVMVIDIALRAIILRSLEQRLDPLENYILGNVYFLSAEVPAAEKDTSAVLALRLEESKFKRLKKKLSMSKKRYIREEISIDEERANRHTTLSDDIFDDDDIFSIPMQEN